MIYIFSFNRQESQHQVCNCPVDREKLERSQVHKTGNKSLVHAGENLDLLVEHPRDQKATEIR